MECSSNDLQILIANGVNLDLLGTREPDIYGGGDLSCLEKNLRQDLPGILALVSMSNVKLTFYQSNAEGDFLQKIGEPWDGIVLNSGAWTHTSLAIADRLKATKTLYTEVHISNISARESFRMTSFSAGGSCGVSYGYGLYSYRAALVGLLSLMR